jgi:hypothetical protein
MLWDAGLPATSMDNATAVRAKIQEMEETFQLVMLAERFDESMVLMKDLLCWDYRQDTLPPKCSCFQSPLQGRGQLQAECEEGGEENCAQPRSQACPQVQHQCRFIFMGQLLHLNVSAAAVIQDINQFSTVALKRCTAYSCAELPFEGSTFRPTTWSMTTSRPSLMRRWIRSAWQGSAHRRHHCSVMQPLISLLPRQDVSGAGGPQKGKRGDVRHVRRQGADISPVLTGLCAGLRASLYDLSPGY